MVRSLEDSENTKINCLKSLKNTLCSIKIYPFINKNLSMVIYCTMKSYVYPCTTYDSKGQQRQGKKSLLETMVKEIQEGFY